MSYHPTPAGLKRDIRIALYVLAVARSNLDTYYPQTSPTEEGTSAGTCYEPEHERGG